MHWLCRVLASSSESHAALGGCSSVFRNTRSRSVGVADNNNDIDGRRSKLGKYLICDRSPSVIRGRRLARQKQVCKMLVKVNTSSYQEWDTANDICHNVQSNSQSVHTWSKPSWLPLTSSKGWLISNKHIVASYFSLLLSLCRKSRQINCEKNKFETADKK